MCEVGNPPPVSLTVIVGKKIIESHNVSKLFMSTFKTSQEKLELFASIVSLISIELPFAYPLLENLSALNSPNTEQKLYHL